MSSRPAAAAQWRRLVDRHRIASVLGVGMLLGWRTRPSMPAAGRGANRAGTPKIDTISHTCCRPSERPGD